MSLSFQPYNLTLPSFSPVFTYVPYRDGSQLLGWNSSYTDYSVADALNNQAAVTSGYFRGVGTAYHTTSFPGASVNLDFTGTAIYLCLSTDSPWTLTVDGQQVQTTSNPSDDACAEYGSHTNQLSIATNLPLGAHSATLQATGGSLNFYGATVTMNAGQPGPKKTEVIDDSDLAWSWQGTWDVETDDTYMWKGSYRSGQTYDAGTVASYTFQNATALVLRGLSEANYGPYTISLDDNQTVAFNASELYWRHSQTVMYFASGLDPTQSHTIKIINYDPNNPKPTPISPSALLSVCVDSLTLIMDDTASRDALLSSISQAPTTPTTAPTSSGVSVGPIVAGVLGGLLVLVIGSNAFFIVLWRRLKKELQLGRYTASNSELEKDAMPPAPIPWSTAATGPSSVALLSAESSSQTSWTPPTPRMSSFTASAQRPEKRPLRTVANPSSVEREPRSPTSAGSQGLGYQQHASGSGSTINHSNQQTATADPRALGALVNNLSSLLNGHLREEYMQRERQIEEGSEPPQYGDH